MKSMQLKPINIAVVLALSSLLYSPIGFSANHLAGIYHQKVEDRTAHVINTNVDVDTTDHHGLFLASGNGSELTFTGSSFLAKNHVTNSTDDFGWRRPTIEAVDGGTINIGTDQVRLGIVEVTSTTDKDMAVGLHAWRNTASTNASAINVHADTLKIDVTSTDYWAYGIYTYSQNGEPCLVNIDAADTIINVSGGISSVGIISWSKSQVRLNQGNVFISADTAVNTRGESVVQINADGNENYVVQINGDVGFEYDGEHSGTTTDSDLNIRLMNDQSYLKGNIQEINDTGNIYNVLEAKLEVSNGALWELDDDSFVNQLTMNKGRLSVASTEANVEVDLINGSGAEISLAAAVNPDQTLTTGTVIFDQVEGTPDFSVVAAGINADDVIDGKKAVESLQGKVSAAGSTITNTINEGDINGAIIQTIDKNGNAGSVQVLSNQKLDGYSSIAALSAVQWRHENDTLLKRMGELRDSEGNVGAWARLYGSEQEYGAQSVTAKNTTIQVGSDYDVGAGWKLGGAFSYTDGSTTFDMGDSDSDMYGVAVYGTWLSEDGQFVDLLAKYSRLSNEFTSGSMKGDFDNNAFSFSAEAGWRFNLSDLAFVEPSAGLTYGRIMGDDFTAHNGVLVEQDDYDSLIGRLGVRSGFYFPNQKGNIYARVAVLHDFMGDMESTASKANQQGVMHYSHLKDELGDTWVEYGLGANFNLSETAYTFVDLEKTSGGEVKEGWKWTLGMRLVF